MMSPATNEMAGSELVAVHAMYVDQAEPATPATVRSTPKTFRPSRFLRKPYSVSPLKTSENLLVSLVLRMRSSVHDS